MIGVGHPPLVISEIGINHEGSLQVAFKMVDAAYKSGAEIIKHQTHVVEVCTACNYKAIALPFSIYKTSGEKYCSNGRT